MSCGTEKISIILSVFCVAIWAAEAWSSGINDTGQLQCYDARGKVIDCLFADDDGRYGRDAAAYAQSLGKIGKGNAGFDFTKIANDGSELPFSTQLGDKSRDWACTRDNVTGLMWEVKTAFVANLRFGGHRYSWFSTDVNTNGGNSGYPGSPNSDSCKATLPDGLCNTEAYVSAVNANNLCGYSDWRLPRLSELQSLVDFGAKNATAIDPDFFPNTERSWFWASEARKEGEAWNINFSNGLSGAGNKGTVHPVLLVRDVR